MFSLTHKPAYPALHPFSRQRDPPFFILVYKRFLSFILFSRENDTVLMINAFLPLSYILEV